MKQPEVNSMLAEVVAIRLENDRKVMMALWGKGYADQVARYRSMIESERQVTQCDLLPAALNCCQRIQRRGEGDELTISMLMAAAVEMIEPAAAQEPPASETLPFRGVREDDWRSRKNGPASTTRDGEASG